MNLLNQLRFRLKWPIFLEIRTPPGWSGSAPFYKMYCVKHQWVETYPSGHALKLFCPKCLREAALK